MDESELIRAAQGGDVEAFNELVRAYQGQVYSTARRILRDPDSAADATQEAFFAAFRRIRQFGRGSFEGWLMRIVVNRCYDQLRPFARHPTASLEALSRQPDEGNALWRTRRASPHEQAEQQELAGILENGLSTLPPYLRVTLVLADIDEYQYAEIAEITGTNIGTVKSRLSRARAGLREYLVKQQVLTGTARSQAAPPKIATRRLDPALAG